MTIAAPAPLPAPPRTTHTATMVLLILLGLWTMLLGLSAIGFGLYGWSQEGDIVNHDELPMFLLCFLGSGAVLLLVGLIHVVTGILIRKGSKVGGGLSILTQLFHGLLCIAAIVLGVLLVMNNREGPQIMIGAIMIGVFVLTGVLLLILLVLVIRAMRTPRPA